MFIGIILVLVLAVGLPIKYMIENSVIESLPGKIDHVSFYNGEFQDYTEFEKYTFKDSERLRKKLDDHKYLKLVKADDIEYLAGFFENFEGWIDDYEIYSEYDLETSCIDEEDYFYMEKADVHVDEEGRKWYGYYDLYFFDTQSMQAYFMHNNI